MITENKTNQTCDIETTFLSEDELLDIAEEIANTADPQDFEYMELNTYSNDKLELCFQVKGGYERDINCYWGSDEYVEDFIKSIDHLQVKSASYELDHEDLTGVITITL